ncbi:MAG: nickel-dependent hydrogenase large subunit, partial [Candidatus Thorarchaeota archaeon]
NFNYNDELTTNVYNLLKISSDINRLIGGRITHPITVIPGGIISNPKKNNFLLIQKQLKRAKDYARAIIEFFINVFAKFNPPEEFDLSDLTFLGLSNEKSYSRYDGNLTIKDSDSKFRIIESYNYQTLFDKDIELYGINFHNLSSNRILTGPYARFQIKNYDIIQDYINQFEKIWKKNLLFNNFLQLIEIFLEIQQCLEFLNDDFISSKWVNTILLDIKNRDGIGLIEAPRGLLMHHYHIDDNQKIDNAKLFIATEINLPFINNMIGKYAKKLFLKQDLNVVKEKVQIMIRSFDPCISCLSH